MTKTRFPVCLFQLLLGTKLIRVTALLLAAVCRTKWQTGVALAADLAVAVVLARKGLERWLNNGTTTAQTQHQVERRLLLDVVVRQGPVVLELLASKNQALLVRRNTLLVHNFRLDINDTIRGLHLEGDRLAGQGLDEDLHSGELMNAAWTST